MDKKIRIVIIICLLLVLWFTLVVSFIDVFRMSYAIIDLQDLSPAIDLSESLLFFNLNSGLRLEGIQIVLAGGFLLMYYSKKRK